MIISGEIGLDDIIKSHIAILLIGNRIVVFVRLI